MPLIPVVGIDKKWLGSFIALRIYDSWMCFVFYRHKSYGIVIKLASDNLKSA